MIPKELYPSGEIAPEDIASHLEADCISHEKETYFRPLLDEEIQDRREQIPTLEMQTEDLKDELKLWNADIKGKIKPLEARRKQMVKELRAGQVEERGETYALLFHEDKKVGVFDRFGRLIRTRSMTPEERQQKFNY